MGHLAGPALDAVAVRGAKAAPRAEPRTLRELIRQLLLAAEGERPRLGFYAALRRIECFYRDLPRLGEATTPAHEPVRFGQDPSLAFQAAALTSVSAGDEQRPPRIGIGFFGMFGPHGALPTHLTSYALERRRHFADATLTGFLDIFQHRMTALLFRSWADAQPTLNLDRPDSDRFARYLGALIGQSTSARARPPSELDRVALYTAVHFSAQTRHPEGLAKVLQACFGIPAQVEEFVGQWLPIPDAYCWRLPSQPCAAEPPLGVLGESTRVGTEVWDRQAKFRVVLGPLTSAEHAQFLPGRESLARLVELIERYAGPELSWDLRLVLREPDRQPAVLGERGLVGHTAHLGFGEAAGAFEDLVIDPQHGTVKEPSHE